MPVRPVHHRRDRNAPVHAHDSRQSVAGHGGGVLHPGTRRACLLSVQMDLPITPPVIDPLLEPAPRSPGRSLSGTPGATVFEQIMRQHNQRLYRLAFSLIGDASEAEDVLQDSYVRAFRGLPHFAGRSSLGSWLAAIV